MKEPKNWLTQEEIARLVRGSPNNAAFRMALAAHTLLAEVQAWRAWHDADDDAVNREDLWNAVDVGFRATDLIIPELKEPTDGN